MSEQTPPEKIRLTISQIKADLGSGLDRKAIALKYGLRAFEAKTLFQHPKLKGIRVGAERRIEIVEDDTEDTNKTISPKVPTVVQPEKPASRVDLLDEEEPDTEDTTQAPGKSIKEVESPADNDVISDTGQW